MTSSLLIHAVEVALALCIALGSSVWLVTLTCALFFRVGPRHKPARSWTSWPPVTLMKPIYGLEKKLQENLRTACLQDYPDYQVICSVQRLDDPAIPLLHELACEFGSDRVSVVVESAQVGLNGKINNLAGALPHARHELLVISDSDVRLQPDYLKTIIAPLADPEVGAVTTFFRAAEAEPWYEQMELLTLNADQTALAMAAHVTGLVNFCFGASTALSKTTLERIGGLEALADYLVEDNEMGQRILRAGKKLVVLPYVVDMMVDLSGAASWWQKQTYWDQNTKAAVPGVFAASFLLRVIPLGLVFAALRGFDRIGLAVLLAASVLRLTAAAVVLGLALRDRRSLCWLWLVPIKDTLSLFWFARSFIKRTVVWRGVEMSLTRDGRLMPLRTERAP
jgi:ceramide glucosyltransferase